MTGKIVGVLVADNNSTDTNSILVQGILTNGNQQGNVSVKITNETQIFIKMEINLIIVHLEILNQDKV